MRNRRYTAVLLLVGLLLSASAARAFEARSADRGNKPTPAGHSAVTLAHYLGSLLWSLWSKTGCQIDPLGRCVNGGGENGATVLTGDEGCAIDPAGACHR